MPMGPTITNVLALPVLDYMREFHVKFGHLVEPPAKGMYWNNDIIFRDHGRFQTEDQLWTNQFIPDLETFIAENKPCAIYGGDSVITPKAWRNLMPAKRLPFNPNYLKISLGFYASILPGLPKSRSHSLVECRRISFRLSQGVREMDLWTQEPS
jgi:hypothetical protein